MRLEVIVSRGDLPVLEKKLVTNFGEAEKYGRDRGGFSSRMLTFCLLAGHGGPLVQGQERERGILDP